MYNLIQWPRHSCMWHSTLYKKKNIRCLYSFLWILFICIYLLAFYFTDIWLDKSSSWRSLILHDSDWSGQWGPMRGTRWFSSVTATYGSLWPPLCLTRSSGMWYVQVSLFLLQCHGACYYFIPLFWTVGRGARLEGYTGLGIHLVSPLSVRLTDKPNVGYRFIIVRLLSCSSITFCSLFLMSVSEKHFSKF